MDKALRVDGNSCGGMFTFDTHASMIHRPDPDQNSSIRAEASVRLNMVHGIAGHERTEREGNDE